MPRHINAAAAAGAALLVLAARLDRRRRALRNLDDFAEHASWRCGDLGLPWLDEDCFCGLTVVQRAGGLPVDVGPRRATPRRGAAPTTPGAP